MKEINKKFVKQVDKKNRDGKYKASPVIFLDGVLILKLLLKGLKKVG